MVTILRIVTKKTKRIKMKKCLMMSKERLIQTKVLMNKFGMTRRR
jgi:hypothetical protein